MDYYDVLQQPLVAFSQKENLVPMIIIVPEYHNVLIYATKGCDLLYRRVKKHHISLQAIIHILNEILYG